MGAPPHLRENSNAQSPAPDLSLSLNALHPREVEKLRSLAEARGEKFDEAFVTRAFRNLLKVVPASIKPLHLIPQEIVDLIQSVEREGDSIVVRLTDGTVLKTFPARQQYRNYFYCFRDRLPASFGPEHYQACHDVRFRYREGEIAINTLRERGLFVPSETASIIECGAYNGWKALGYGKHVGRDGTLLVLEIDPAQYALALENVTSNLAGKRHIVLNTGVWNTVEEKSYAYEAFASHSLRAPDEHDHFTQTGTIVTDTLDNIIDRSGTEVFDFLNVQTGGSETEALEGLERNLGRVKVMWIGSHYRHEGISIRYRCLRHLLERDCVVFDREMRRIRRVEGEDPARTGGLFTVTPAHVDTFRDTIAHLSG
jgi:FkbM family methyltransferase